MSALNLFHLSNETQVPDNQQSLLKLDFSFVVLFQRQTETEVFVLNVSYLSRRNSVREQGRH